jgi:GNAT superfamily N-acetyltransferase
MRLRTARPDEADALSALIMRSKAYWGYDDAFLDSCRDELRLRPDDVEPRRTTVAEQDGNLLGVSTLEGESPDGVLGLLFVAPEAIRGGVGRALYQHVLDEAERLGFTRVTIESDHNAVGFYLAMGARRLHDNILLAAWPEPAWSVAWSRGGATVHVGNVAEFNGQFTGGVHGPDHYSCLAAFCGPRPEMVVLPQRVDDWWVDHVTSVLGWGEVEVHSGIAPDGRVSEAILSRPELLERLTSRGAPVRPWGRTAAFEAINPGGALDTIRRYESKKHAHDLFKSLAYGHPGILVPTQRHVRSHRELARELARGKRLVVKKEYGAGGSGTLVVSPDGQRVPRRMAGDVLVEEYVEGAGPYRDPTFDAVIDADGVVHPVGVGLMEVEGTGYRGVTVGPGVLPDQLTDTAVGFGTAVGRVLAAEGYQGWYDVDFVTDGSGRLAPVETNVRLTGPSVAFNIQATLDRVRGGRHFVRTLDVLPLGARLPARALRDHVARLGDMCPDATLLVTIPTAAFDLAPYLGLAIAARTATALDTTEAVIRDANTALGAMFAGLVSPGDVPVRRKRRLSLRRS